MFLGGGRQLVDQNGLCLLCMALVVAYEWSIVLTWLSGDRVSEISYHSSYLCLRGAASRIHLHFEHEDLYSTPT
jgi:hypothetical protein